MLYQSIQSDTCAICAVANLLYLYGISCPRSHIVRLFKTAAKDSSPVVNHAMISRTIENRIGGSGLKWKALRRFSFETVSRALTKPFLGGAPVLLTFDIRHREKRWYGIHCVVAVEQDDAGIHIIDSLGRRDGRQPNAVITPHALEDGWPVAGAPIVVTRNPARILEGLPRLKQCAWS